ncbi:ABATE domain-containing protein [Rhizobium sp. BK251]|uniref:CGNR zinc finger domain-containing protein n=1 Tax=Rhizobium sp. BK251 TaxID=2512125 RepID=UPI001044C249|nr:ABATE domain-containing protein [Rhizobium sp. BK251]TCL76212.1 putative RNA-binding Zn ribbon-like protein [Rhizobium sp. BK251]
MTDLVPFVGEPLGLDLVNTRPATPEGRVDLIGDLEGLKAWLGLEADRLPAALQQAAETLSDSDLAPVHAVREHATTLMTCLTNAEKPPQAALDGLNAAMRASPTVGGLVWEEPSVAMRASRSGPPGNQLAACLAESVAELAGSPQAGPLHQCEADDCVMLFVQTNARRRWCSAARCGNRMRVARYYRRSKAG